VPQHGPAKEGRYDAALIARRVELMRVACKETAASAAAAVGLSAPAWSKKVRLEDSSFTNEELGRIADHFAEVTGRRLVGWPFVDEAISSLLDAKRRR
jgi:hypothetical protein